MFAKYIFLITLILIMLKGYCQNNPGEMKILGKIYGQVVNQNNGEPVEFASVRLYNLMDTTVVLGTMTNQHGDFIINEVPIGLNNLEVSFVGFKKTRINQVLITPKVPEIFFGKLEIEPTSINLAEISITAEQEQFEYKSGKKVINIEKDIVAKGGSVVDALENVPAVTTDMEGNLTLRGSSNYTVLINGRPIVLKGSDALQQIPSNTVSSVEIITNPSAKFDPEGEVGIINVITKKTLSEGLTGLMNSSYGSLNKYSTEGAFNYNFGKFAVNSSFNISNNPMEGKMSRLTESLRDNNLLLRNSDMNMAIGRKLVNAGLGLNFMPDKRNNFNLETSLGSQTFDRNSYAQIISNQDSISYLLANSDNTKNTRFISTTFNYQHLFDLAGHKLDASAFYAHSISNQDNLLNEDISDLNWVYQATSIFQQFNEDGNGNELRFNVDYNKPLKNNNKLELGYQGKIENDNLDQNFKFNNFQINENFKNNGITNIARNTQVIYGLFSGNLYKIDYKIGLRVGGIQQQVKQEPKSNDFNYQRIDVFPSLHLSYSKGLSNQLQFSYSRRQNSPSFSFLNPYLEFIDKNTYRQGNPNLEPEFINSFELNYSKRILFSFISAELYYRETVNKITPFWLQQDDGPLLISYENLDNDNFFGLDLMANLNVFKWWKMMLGASFYNYNIQGDVLGYDINNSSNTMNLRLNSRFKIEKSGTQIQLMGIYNSPKASAQGSRAGFFVSSIGINQEIIKNKLTATLQVRDIFNSMKFETVSEEAFYTNDVTFKPSTPFYSVSLNFKFNNFKKSSQQFDNINEFNFEESIY